MPPPTNQPLSLQAANCLNIPTPYGQPSYLSRFSKWYHHVSQSYHLIPSQQYNENLNGGDFILQKAAGSSTEKTVKIAREHVPWIIFAVHVLLQYCTCPTFVHEHLQRLKFVDITLEMVKHILPWCIHVMAKPSEQWPELSKKPREPLGYDEMMSLWQKVHNHHISHKRLNLSAKRATLVFFGLYKQEKQGGHHSYVVFFIDHTTQATWCFPSFTAKHHNDFKDNLNKALKTFMKTHGQPKAFFFMNPCIEPKEQWLAQELHLATHNLHPYDPIVSLYLTMKDDELPIKIADAFYNLSCHLHSDYRTARILSKREHPYKKSFLVVDLPKDAHHSETDKSYMAHNMSLPPKQTARFFTKQPKLAESRDPTTSSSKKRTLFYMDFPGPSRNIKKFHLHTHLSSLNFGDPRTTPDNLNHVTPPVHPMGERDREEITQLVRESFRFSLAPRDLGDLNHVKDLTIDSSCRSIINYLSHEHYRVIKMFKKVLTHWKHLPAGTKSCLSRGKKRKEGKKRKSDELEDSRVQKRVRFEDELSDETIPELKVPQEPTNKRKRIKNRSCRGKRLLCAFISFLSEPAIAVTT